MTSRDNQGDHPTLPRKSGNSPEFIPGGSGASDANGEHIHILVVDDEASIRLSLHRFLTRLGYTVSIARNGSDALTILGDTRVDLVITDLVMPDYDGRQLILQMRADYPMMPVLVISGFPAALLPDPGPDGKPVPFLAKPFALDALASEVHRLLQERASQARG